MGNAAQPQEEASVSVSPPQTCFCVGDAAEYFSNSQSAWIDCRIIEISQQGDVQISCKPGYWMSLTEQATELQPVSLAMPTACHVGRGAVAMQSTEPVMPSMSAIRDPPCPDHGRTITAPAPGGHWSFIVGDKVDYYSDSHQRWFPCSVTAVSERGTIQVDVKPGYWIPLEEQACKIKPRSKDPGAMQALNSRPSLAQTFRPGAERKLSPESLAAHNAALNPVDSCALRCPTFTEIPGGALTRTLPVPPQTKANSTTVPETQTLSLPSTADAMFAPCSQASLQSTTLDGSGYPGAFGSQASCNSVMAQFHSVHSTASLPVAAARNRVNFDPAVAVTAFKSSCPPGQMHSAGKTFECNLESSIHVPYSFSSLSSGPSSCGSAYTSRAQGPSPSFSNTLSAISETARYDNQNGA